MTVQSVHATHMSHSCLAPAIDPQLPDEEIGLCTGTSTEDHGMIL